MTTNKDFKRLVRTRMVKTGESYTTARSHFLRRRKPDEKPGTPPPPPSGTVDYEQLSGMRNESIKAATGCDWKRWVEALDYVKAHEWTHTDIARYIREKFRISGWWSQSVTVGYERIKGLRAIGQRRSGEFEASKSKTFDVPVSRLYAAFSHKRSRDKWLGPVDLKVGATIKNRSFRMTWTDGRPVAAWFESKSPRKAVVGVTHHKLPDKATAEKVKAEWAGRLEKLGEALS